MTIREMPKTRPLSDHAWKEFNWLADEHGVGKDEEDWKPWYEFYYEGFLTGAAGLRKD